MDVLFINPPWVTKNGNVWHGIRSTMPPLGLLCVASYAESQGAAIGVLDAHAERMTFDDIRNYIAQRQPRYVALTAVTAVINAARRVACVAKEACPTCKTVLGGAHPSAVPRECLRDPAIDFVICGEGEHALHKLIRGDSHAGIAGLGYRNRLGFPCVNPQGEPIRDLDALPPPAYHLVPMDKYRPAVGSYKRLPAINMLSTRGCPGKCTFCASAETALRHRSAVNIVGEIELLQRQYGIRQVNFYDDTFTIYKQHVESICDLIIERGIDVSWSCFARTDCVSPHLLAKMGRAGCHQIMFGIESGDPDMLARIGKPISLERTREAVRMCRTAGIEVRAAFMFGNQGETRESIERTTRFAIELDPDIAIFNIATPYPGTKLFRWASDNGYLRTTDWDEFDLAQTVLELPTIRSEEVVAAYRQAYRRFYMRPRYLARRMLRMKSLTEIRMNLAALRSVLAAKGSGHGRKPAGAEHARPAPKRVVASEGAAC